MTTTSRRPRIDRELLARAIGTARSDPAGSFRRMHRMDVVRSSTLLIALAAALGLALAAGLGAAIYGISSLLHHLSTA